MRSDVAYATVSKLEEMVGGLWNYVCSEIKEDYVNQSYSHIKDGKVKFYELTVTRIDGVDDVRLTEMRKCAPAIRWNLNKFRGDME